MSEHTFCRNLLAEARTQIKRSGIKIPSLSSWRDSKESNTWMEIWTPDRMVWQGTAHCVADAKAKYLFDILDGIKPVPE